MVDDADAFVIHGAGDGEGVGTNLGAGAGAGAIDDAAEEVPLPSSKPAGFSQLVSNVTLL